MMVKFTFPSKVSYSHTFVLEILEEHLFSVIAHNPFTYSSGARQKDANRIINVAHSSGVWWKNSTQILIIKAQNIRKREKYYKNHKPSIRKGRELFFLRSRVMKSIRGSELESTRRNVCWHCAHYGHALDQSIHIRSLPCHNNLRIVGMLGKVSDLWIIMAYTCLIAIKPQN